MTDPYLAIPTPNGRHYKAPTRPAAVPSVTNIMRQKSKPAINKYNIRTAAEYAVNHYEEQSSLTPAEKVHLAKESVYQKSPESIIGDVVHGWIDAYIKTGDHPRDQEPAEHAPAYTDAPITARRMWRQFEGFRGRYNPKFLDAEFTCWSDRYGYAGTADFAMEMAGLLILADTKTGKAVYPDVGYQLAALAKADFIMARDGSELPMPKWDRCAALHIRPTYSRLVPVENIDSCFESFLGLLTTFKHETYKSESVLGYAPKIQTDYKGV